jgi:hypothetical protein
LSTEIHIIQEEKGRPVIEFGSKEEIELLKKVTQKQDYEIILNFEGHGIETSNLIEILKNLSEEMFEKVVALNLNYNDIQYLPEEIGKFKNLVVLHLAENPLKELPTAIENFDLAVLTFPETEIIAVPEKEILKMKNLRILSIGNEIIFSDNFIKNVRENITFYFNGKDTNAEKSFYEKKKRLK